MLIDNGKLESEKEVEKKPAYGSSSSSEDSSASDENDDSDKAFLDAAEKGILYSGEFFNLGTLNGLKDYSSLQGNLERVQNLLKGRSIDVKDIEGNTALLRATEHGHEKMVEWLLQNGASVR